MMKVNDFLDISMKDYAKIMDMILFRDKKPEIETAMMDLAKNFTW